MSEIPTFDVERRVVSLTSFNVPPGVFIAPEVIPSHEPQDKQRAVVTRLEVSIRSHIEKNCILEGPIAKYFEIIYHYFNEKKINFMLKKYGHKTKQNNTKKYNS